MGLLTHKRRKNLLGGGDEGRSVGDLDNLDWSGEDVTGAIIKLTTRLNKNELVQILIIESCK